MRQTKYKDYRSFPVRVKVHKVKDKDGLTRSNTKTVLLKSYIVQKRFYAQ